MVVGANRTAMLPNCRIGDRQSDAVVAAFTITRIFPAHEWLKQLAELFLCDPGAVISYTNRCREAVCGYIRCNIDRGVFSGMRDRVPHDVFSCTFQQRTITANNRRAFAGHIHKLVAIGSLIVCVTCDIFEQLIDSDIVVCELYYTGF